MRSKPSWSFTSPATFPAKVESGQPAKVQFILDGRRSNAAQIVQGYALTILDQFNSSHPVKLVPRNWFNPNLSYTWYTVPSLIVILSTVSGLMVTSLSVARERELGTFDQLLVSPLKPFEVLMGKAFSAYVIAFFQALLIIWFAIYVFRVPINGSIWLLLGSLSIFLVATIGMGLLMSALARTQQQAITSSFVFMIPGMILSGFASPVEKCPEHYKSLLKAIPETLPNRSERHLPKRYATFSRACQHLASRHFCRNRPFISHLAL